VLQLCVPLFTEALLERAEKILSLFSKKCFAKMFVELVERAQFIFGPEIIGCF